MSAAVLALSLLLLIFVPQLPRDPPKPLIPPFKLSQPPQSAPTDDLHDNSDWFSGLRPTGQEGELAGEVDAPPTQERQLPASNFRILGIDLSPDMFEPIRQTFGDLHEVQRGDAAAGRHQACYVSAATNSNVHLIFEQGEVSSALYLFTGGPDWYGSNRCISSHLITPRLATASGLHLGMTPAQVIAIFGKPSICQIPAPLVAASNTSNSAANPQAALAKAIPYPCGHRPATKRAETELVYSLHKIKTMTAEERADFLRKNLTLTEADADRFATYDWSAGIDARFTHSRLSFLSLSVAETN